MENDSILVGFLGKSPTVKIIDHFASWSTLEYSLTDIAEGSGASYASVKKIVPVLVTHEFLIPTRRIGKARMFKINLKNRVVKQFLTFNDALTKQEVRRYLKEEGIDIETIEKTNAIEKEMKGEVKA